MAKCIKWVFILILAVFSYIPAAALAAEIVIIKSNDITPYNQTIAGFAEEMGADYQEYDLEGMPENAAGIIKRIRSDPPRLIFALGALAAIEVKEYFSDIPVIYTVVLAPEDKGLTGENLTGISIVVAPTEQLTALKSVVPGIKRVGVLYSRLTEKLITQARKSCAALGMKLIAVKLEKAEDVPDDISELLPQVDALWLIADRIVVNKNSLQYIILQMLENRIPLLAYNKNFVKAGALLSVAVNYSNLGRQAAKLAQKKLQGGSLAETVLPPEGFEYATNLKIARHIGLKLTDQTLELFEYIYE